MISDATILWIGPAATSLPLSVKQIEDMEEVKHLQSETAFKAICLNVEPRASLTDRLSDLAQPYRLIVDNSIHLDPLDELSFQPFYRDLSQVDQILADLEDYFYDQQYGDKFFNQDAILSPNFAAKAKVLGQTRLLFSKLESSGWSQVLAWKRNLYLDGKYPLYLKQDFHAQPGLELKVVIRAFDLEGRLAWEKEESLVSDQGFEVKTKIPLYLSFSLHVRGKGDLVLGPFHQRFSHGPYGQLLVGGQEEEGLIFYFHPGDRNPPLNVYFAGYRPAEGFEGYPMMKRLGAPFVLIADTRSEGGYFYLGNREFENKLVKRIENYLDQLNFRSQDLILSGLSMGTYGALYYASLLDPSAVIVGKPLIHLGDVAQHHKTLRPQEFGTALDLLLYEERALDETAVQRLNHHFWQAFSKTRWQGKTLALAYMQDDDYDPKAFSAILEALEDQEVHLISFSRPGRHNDQSQALVTWFTQVFEDILAQNFARKGREDWHAGDR